MSDIVTDFNELEYREKFCESVGHTSTCVEDTIDNMISIINKVALIHNIADIDSLIDQMGVEQFEHHLTKLLFYKYCNCKKETK